MPKLRDLPAADRASTILTGLLTETGRLLGGLEAADLDPDEGFIDAGLDSLRIIELREWIEASFELDVETTLALDQPTPKLLAEHLAQLLFPADAAPALDADGVASPEDLDALDAAALRALLQRERSDREARDHEPIAVIGLSCRLPGPATDPQGFWDLLLSDEDAISEVPTDRWSLARYFDPDPSAAGKSTVKYGGFLPDIATFDARFFNVSPREAEELDPQQRLLLELAWEALEDAAVDPDRTRERSWGVFVGTRASEYFDSQCGVRELDVGPYYATGNAISTAAGRLSYFLGWRGPCFALDTACSGSLVAVHNAIQSLRRGECEAALAGGVNLIIDPASHVALSNAQMLAPDGRCKTFDESANGYVRAEGGGFVLLKRLSQARADGDPIRAVLLGSAINQDGASGGLTVPSGAAQEAVLKAALDDARLQPQAVDYIEAHGTGTSLGDPIEVAALDRVFGASHSASNPLRLGSVKTNIGHAEAAAGISGLLKVLLALEHERLPRHRNLVTPSPHIPWDRSCVRVLTEHEAWASRADRPRVAGVSSFGFSGTNAHIVVGEAPREEAPRASAARPRLLPLSAASAAALDGRIAQLQALAGRLPSDDAAAWERTLSVGRTALPERAVLVLGADEDLGAAIAQFAAGSSRPLRGRAPRQAPRIAFAFTGQGSQRAAMGARLAAVFPVFAGVVDRLQPISEAHGFSLRELLFEADAAHLAQTRFTQPAIFAFELAMAELLASFGIRPAASIGHSVGEIAAATCVGMLSPEEGFELVIARGRLMDELTSPGAMLGVRASASLLVDHLQAVGPEVALAAVNAPELCTVSGSTAAIQALGQRLSDAGISATPLAVSHAFHSPLMDPMLGEFSNVASALTVREADRALVSCLRAGDAPSALTGSEFWVRHVREPVQFLGGVRDLMQRDIDLVLEVGPTPHLSAIARRIPEAGAVEWVPAVRAQGDEAQSFMDALAKLFIIGAPLDFAALPGMDTARPLRLPTYPFQRERYWLNASPVAAAGQGGHPLLGARLSLPGDEAGQERYQAGLAAAAPAWLRDHAVTGRPLFPLAGYLELALVAAEAAQRDLSLSGMTVRSPLWLDDEVRPIQTQVDRSSGLVEIHARSAAADRDGSWVLHARANLSVTDADTSAVLDASPRGESLDVAAFYRQLEALGLEYGPAFQSVTAMWRDGASRVIADLELPAAAGRADGFMAHPSMLDGAFQASAALIAADDTRTWLPLSVASVRIHRAVGTRARAVVVRIPERESERSRWLDLQLLDADGACLIAVEGLALVPADAEALSGRDPRAERMLHQVTWPRTAAPLPDALPPGIAFAGAWPSAWLHRPGLKAVHARELATWDEAQLDAAFAATEAVPVFALAPLAGLNGAASEDALLSELAWLRRLVTVAARRTRPFALRVFSLRGEAFDEGAEAVDVWSAARTGYLASLALEVPGVDIRHIDLDPADSPKAQVEHLLVELGVNDGEGRTLWRADQRHRARLRRAGRGPRMTRPDGAFALRTPEYGSLDRLRYVARSVPEPAVGQVALEMVSSGLNYKDVLHGLGMLREFAEALGIQRAEDQPFGMEGVGRVVALGEGAAGCAIGDLVLALGEGTMASHCLAPASQVVPLPDSIDPVRAAGLPVIYLTALYGLEDLANLQAGESVLIHAAAGGVGQAAIAVARRRGARIFATSSVRKHAVLREQGIEDLFDSRSLDFADQIRGLTDGRGVDVVLDSIGGEVLDASLRLLAPEGRCIEIGKLGLPSAEAVREMRPDVAWHVFDLSDEFRAQPELAARLLNKLVAGLADSSLPFVPTRVLPLDEAHRGFEWLARSRHVGKIVFDLAAPAKAWRCREGRSYLVTGGLGALGLATAQHLAARGAEHLVLMGRSAPSDAARVVIDDLESKAVRVQVVGADVTDVQGLGQLVAGLAAAGHPLGGVVHAAGVLDDALLANADDASIARVLGPKVRGAQALDEVTADLDLDCFVLFSSVSGTLGVAGQTAYAAANAALDGLARDRRARGRVGLAVALGPIDGDGMAARMEARDRERIERMGIAFLDPPTVFRAIDAAVQHGAPALALCEVDWAQMLQIPVRREASLLAELKPAESSGSQGSGELLGRLSDASPEERVELLVEVLDVEMARVLGFGNTTGLEEDEGFGSLGIDSLAAVDMKTRLEEELSQTLPATLFFDYPSLRALADHLLELVTAELTGAAESSADEAPPELAPQAASSDDDDDLEARLEAQLARMRGGRGEAGAPGAASSPGSP